MAKKSLNDNADRRGKNSQNDSYIRESRKENSEKRENRQYIRQQGETAQQTGSQGNTRQYTSRQSKTAHQAGLQNKTRQYTSRQGETAQQTGSQSKTVRYTSKQSGTAQQTDQQSERKQHTNRQNDVGQDERKQKSTEGKNINKRSKNLQNNQRQERNKEKKTKKRDLAPIGYLREIRKRAAKREKEQKKAKESLDKERMTRIDKRVALVFMAVMLVFAIVLVRVGYVTLRYKEQYSRAAMSQLGYNSTVDVARPGDILDANGAVIATSYCVYILILDCYVINETEKTFPGTKEATAQMVAETFGLSQEKILEAIEKTPQSRYLKYCEDPDETKTVVSEEEKELFEEKQNAFNNRNKKTAATTENGQEETQAQQNVWAMEEEGKTTEIQTEEGQQIPETEQSGDNQQDNNQTKEVNPAEAANNEGESAADDGKARVKGVWFEKSYRRYYPFGEYASKLIGYRTEDTTQGLWGLELYYNDEINGVNGRRTAFLNEESDVEYSMSERVDGSTIRTSIDITLTKMISEELDEWFADTDKEGNLINSAKSVEVLAMDPRTGEIKAYVTDKDYDLNAPLEWRAVYSEEQLAQFKENDKEYEEEKEKAALEKKELKWNFDEKPTTDYAKNAVRRAAFVSDSYEPGSTGKVMTFAAAIEEGVITADTDFLCEGTIYIDNTRIKCHNLPKGGCGNIDALTAVASSCNVAFVEIGLALTNEKFARYQQIFNFGQKTGIDLPGETSCEGLLYPSTMDDLSLATNAFGQCYNVTMLQLAAAFCSTVNGGYYYKPYIATDITDSVSGMTKHIEPVLVRQTVSEETSAIVKQALRQTVTNDEIGTGGALQWSDGVLIDQYPFIAKTGTAQKLPRNKEQFLISVISALPMDEPELVLYVTIDEYGGALQDDSQPAQWLAGDIWGTIMDYIGIYPEDEPGPEINWTEAAKTGEGWEAGDLPIENAEGGPDDTVVPPSDDGSGTYQGDIPDPDSIINPEDYLPEEP